jgi:hypothetical protein
MVARCGVPWIMGGTTPRGGVVAGGIPRAEGSMVTNAAKCANVKWRYGNVAERIDWTVGIDVTPREVA